MSRCFRSFVQPLSTPVSKFISNHPSLYLVENKYTNMKALQMLLAQVITPGFSGSPNPEIAIDLFVLMLVVALSIQPGGLTYPSVFKDGAQLAVAKDGAQLHGRVVKSGREFDRFIRNRMFKMYANCGLLSEARKLFDENKAVDVVAWNSMITGYAKRGKIADSRKLFDTMQLLEQGKWIHTYMKMLNVKLNVIVITALLNMYCRCGDIKTAYRVFENTTLGYNGFQNEAIQLISRLLQPDSVSFIDFLTACNNSGLVNEAINYFAIMKTIYNIEPLGQLYCCMIDTLGRAGLLEEAEHLTKQMPKNSDAAIWGSLLSAARYHNNVKISTRAAEKSAQLEPDKSVNYMLPRAISSKRSKRE